MAFEQRDNEGSLFINTRKEKDTHANLTGSIRIEGKDYYLNGWVKKDDDGKFKRISLSAKPKDGANKEHAAANSMDDEIPF